MDGDTVTPIGGLPSNMPGGQPKAFADPVNHASLDVSTEVAVPKLQRTSI